MPKWFHGYVTKTSNDAELQKNAPLLRQSQYPIHRVTLVARRGRPFRGLSEECNDIFSTWRLQRCFDDLIVVNGVV